MLHKKFALALATLTLGFASHAGQYGAGLKTPGFEDVAVLDVTSLAVAVGLDDGVAAAPLAAAYSHAQRVGPKEPPSATSITERVFAAHLPHPTTKPAQVGGAELQNMLLQRKGDLIAAKRFLFSMQIEPLLDTSSTNAARDRMVMRDSLGRYAVRFRSDRSFIKTADGVQFLACMDAEAGSAFRSNTGRAKGCVGIPEFKGLNLPAGILVADLSKFGNVGVADQMMFGAGVEGTSTLRAGFILTPAGRTGTADATLQGRNFNAEALVIWDVATFEVLAGPYPLKAKNPDVLYATVNCPTEACWAQVNPTLRGSGLIVKYY